MENCFSMSGIVLIKLSLLKAGQMGKIVEINGGWVIHKRLNQNGIHVGDMFMVKRNAVFKGPIMISIHYCDIALGRGMADHVLVNLAKNGAIIE